MGGTINIFLVYAKEDSAILLQLLRHLDPIKKFVKVHFWYDDPIDANKAWSPQIESRFEEADVYLFLVGNTFMHAKFVEQLEFKMIIDRYKANQSKVIPLILDNCPWDIEFKADDYTFSFKELEVLPEAGKPLNSWKSMEQALHKCAAQIQQVIAPESKDQKEGPAETEKPQTSKYEAQEDQIALSFSEQAEAKSKAEAEKIKVEVTAQKAADAQKLRAEDQALKKAAEERRLQEVAYTKSKADEEKRMIQEAEIKRRRIEDENRLRENNKVNSDRVVVQAESNEAEKGSTPGGNTTRRKQVIFGVTLIALVLLGIVFFPSNNNEDMQNLPAQSKKEAIVGKETQNEGDDANTNEQVKVPTQGAAASMSTLEIGEPYNDGIIFELDEDGKTGILAHTQDIGPMIWNDAIIIHEQLGVGWRLPSRDELKQMYRTIGQGATNSGEFADAFYWSATPFDVNQARVVRFSDGNASYHYNSRGTHRKFLVRAVRDFSK